jgi:hypothetical protein
MTATRRRLADRRASETFQVEHAGLRYTVSFSRFDSGELAECFVQNHKRGGGADTAVRDAGILLSFALQYGCPAEVIARLTRRGDLRPTATPARAGRPSSTMRPRRSTTSRRFPSPRSQPTTALCFSGRRCRCCRSPSR